MHEYSTKRADGRRFAMLIGGPADPVRVWEEVGGKPFPCTTFTPAPAGGGGGRSSGAHDARDARAAKGTAETTTRRAILQHSDGVHKI